MRLVLDELDLSLAPHCMPDDQYAGRKRSSATVRRGSEDLNLTRSKQSGGGAQAARMSGFSAEWLELREPYDLHARNRTVLDAVFDLIADKPSVAIVDLACGTGSTVRALSPRIKARQHWSLVDNDLSLLALVPSALPPGINVSAVPIDLTRDLEAVFDNATDLITTSALLDLVSQDWLNRLAVEAAARRLPVYAALSYDGRVEL